MSIHTYIHAYIQLQRDSSLANRHPPQCIYMCRGWGATALAHVQVAWDLQVPDPKKTAEPNTLKFGTPMVTG